MSSTANDQQDWKRAVSISARGMCPQISSISPDLFFVRPLADGSFHSYTFIHSFSNYSAIWPSTGVGCLRYTQNSKCCNRFLTEIFGVLLYFCTPSFCIDSVTCPRSAELIPASVNFHCLIWTDDSSIIRQCALGESKDGRRLRDKNPVQRFGYYLSFCHEIPHVVRCGSDRATPDCSK